MKKSLLYHFCFALCLLAVAERVKGQSLRIERIAKGRSGTDNQLPLPAQLEKFRLIPSGRGQMDKDLQLDKLTVPFYPDRISPVTVTFNKLPVIAFSRPEFDSKRFAEQILAGFQNSVADLSTGEMQAIKKDAYWNDLLVIKSDSGRSTYLNKAIVAIETEWGQVNGVIITGYSVVSKDGGLVLTVRGTGLGDASFIAIGDKTDIRIEEKNSTTAVAKIPPGITSGRIRVLTKSHGLATASQNLTLPSLIPDKAKANVSNLELTLNGKEFAHDAKVEVDEKELQTEWKSSTQLKATWPTLTPGKHQVSVKGDAHFKATFIVSPKAPSITSFTPKTGPIGTLVRIKGTDLISGSPTDSIRFNGVWAPAVRVIDSLTVDVIVPHGAMSGHLSVITPSGSITSKGAFTVSTLSPDKVKAGSPSLGITIHGAGFGSSTVICFNDIILVPSSVSSTELKAILPASAVAKKGNYTVSVVGEGSMMPAVFTVSP